jgi:NADH:ubiquinone oxidoreductase subunit E
MLASCSCQCEPDENEKISQISDFIERYKHREGSLIQVLHVAQQIYGYLPMHVQRIIADGLDLSLSEVSGVVSFYSFFSTMPKGEHIIRVCLGTACYVRGGKNLVDSLANMLEVDIGGTTDDKLFSLEVARCIGACGLAPAMMIDDKVYKQVSPAKLGSILASYRKVEDEDEGGGTVS